MASDYEKIVTWIFGQHYTPGDTDVEFERSAIVDASEAVGVEQPRNLGDVVYTFRYRRQMPDAIASFAPEGGTWIIEGRGKAKYAFIVSYDKPLVPNPHLAVIKVPDSTPGIITKYVLNSEQALLAKVRYNRLIDLFTGIVCYSLQNHLRAFVETGQIETDEVYLGIDKSGVQYVIPVEAKGGSDKLSVVQMNQDIALAKSKFAGLECRLVGAQFIDDDVSLFLFAEDGDTGTAKVIKEARYRLVPASDISDADLAGYRSNLSLDL